MKKLILTLIALPFLTFAVCDGDMNCIRGELKAAKASHLATYKKYLSTLSKKRKKAFRQGQRRWVADKDSACAIEAGRYRGETREAIESECLTKWEIEREEYILSLMKSKTAVGRRASLAEYKAYLDFMATETRKCKIAFKVGQRGKARECLISLQKITEVQDWKLDSPDVSEATDYDFRQINRDLKEINENFEVITLYLNR